MSRRLKASCLCEERRAGIARVRRPRYLAPMAATKKRVLTVEDSANIRRLIAYNLKRAGYEVLEAADGKAAVKVLQQHVPDLIILDIRMPEMDGFQLLELMRRYPKAAAIPVVMMTALSQPADVDRALKLGVVDYLVKPLDPTLLISKVRTILHEHEGAEPWRGENRRQFVRGSILDVSLDPEPGGSGVDLGEGGISWRSNDPPRVGEVVHLAAPELFAEVGIEERSLRCRVVHVRPVGMGEHRVGAALIGLTEHTRDVIRRYVLARQSKAALS